MKLPVLPSVATATLSLGLAATATSGLAQDTNTLIYAAITEPSSLGLHQDASGATFIPLQAIYEPLLRLDGDMNLQPGLAESWQQLDEVTYEIVLRPDVTFHSGNPLTAADVRDTFAWHINPEAPGYAAAYLNPIGEMEVVDDLTLRITLEAPYGPFPYALSMPHTAISDMTRFAEIGGDGLRTQPSGTGPFMLETWDRGAEVVLRANPNYWGGPVAVDRLRFRFMPEATARAIALETGEVDVVETVAAPDLPRLEANPDIDVVEAYELRAVLWLLNAHAAPLDDLRVRQAIAHAIDYEMIIEALLGDAAQPMGGLVPRGSFGFAELGYDHDPEKAAGLLADAGWSRNAQGLYAKDGQVLRFTHVSGQHLAQEVQVAEAIQALLREFGIELEIQVLERVAHTTTMFAHARGDAGRPDFGTTQWDHGIRTGDASVALDPIFTCGGPRNFTQFCDPDYDARIRVAVSGAAPEERLQAFADAQRMLLDQVAALPLWQPRITMASRSRVENVQLTPTRVLYFDQLRLAP